MHHKIFKNVFFLGGLTIKRKVLSSVLAMLIGASSLVGCATTTVEEAGETFGDNQAAETTETASTTESEASSTTLSGEGDETIHVFLYMQEHEKVKWDDKGFPIFDYENILRQ